MSITRIHHHTITVSDVDRSLQFYCDLLGFRVVYDRIRENLPAYDKVMALKDVRLRVVLLNDPSQESILALLQYLYSVPQRREMNLTYFGSTAVAMQTDDLNADYHRLCHAGVRFTSEPVDVVRDGKFVARLAYAFAPDEIVVQLYQPMG